MIDTPPDPSTSCVIDGRRLRLPGALTCRGCTEALDVMLDPANGGHDGIARREPPSIPVLFALLDPRPGRGAPGRGAPGFAAAIPISAHVASMRDRRSAGMPVSSEPSEQRAGAAPVHAGVVLEGYVRTVADDRRVDVPRIRDTRPRDTDFLGPMTWRQHDLATSPLPPDLDVAALAAFLRRHLDWIVQQLWVDEFDTQLRELRAQLRAATGDPRPRSIGRCPNTLDDDEHSHECGAPLWVANYSDAVRCPACSRVWSRREWLGLGLLIDSDTEEKPSEHDALDTVDEAPDHEEPDEEARTRERNGDIRGPLTYPPPTGRGRWGMPRVEDRPPTVAYRRFPVATTEARTP